MIQRLMRKLIVPCISIAAVCSAKTLTVGKFNAACPKAQFSTITAALAAAGTGDVIEVCPAVYNEQLLITRPVTIQGIDVQNLDRVVIRPSAIVPMGGLTSEAVVTVMNTRDVTLQNISVDASGNNVSGCDTVLAGIHYFNASGSVQEDAIYGAKVSNPQACGSFVQLLLFGTGFGVFVDGNGAGPYHVQIANNSVHDYTRNGVLAVGDAITVDVQGNTISGIGPAIGVPQFGVFIANGALGRVTDNIITEGLCGTLDIDTCIARRSEGVVLRAAAVGSTVDRNVITNAQSGIFVNGGANLHIGNNQIRNIQALSGMDLQGSATGSLTNSVIEGNVIVNVGPVNQTCSDNGECCGITEYPGTGVSGNRIVNTTVNDAFCGVAAVRADRVQGSKFYNVLYMLLDADAGQFPPAY